MPDITVEEFAQDVGVSVERIQEQLIEAGLSDKNAEDILSGEGWFEWLFPNLTEAQEDREAS